MRSRRTWALALGLAAVLAGAAACSGSPAKSASGPSGTGASSAQVQTSAAQITASIRPGASQVSLNRLVRLNVTGGTFTAVVVSSALGAVAGELSADKSTWLNTQPLQPGQTYQVTGTAVDQQGLTQKYSAHFHTADLPLSKLTFPSLLPLPGATVGIGMPAIIHFDVPVIDHAAFQKHLKVTSVPAQAGGFHWISDNEVHWRPKTYWKPGTTVTVSADIGGVPAGNGVFGQKSRTETFTIGRSMISRVNIRTDQLQVFRDGQLVRTIPITTGKQPAYTTRSGVKIIVEKLRHTRMNSETIGINPNSAAGYNIGDVQFAMRLTYSGEFLHAAPWSVASQGHANVSHGCTGMSLANAQWLFDNSMIGDVVEYTGSDKPMTLSNGYGDWNLPFVQYAQGSAL